MCLRRTRNVLGRPRPRAIHIRQLSPGAVGRIVATADRGRLLGVVRRRRLAQLVEPLEIAAAVPIRPPAPARAGHDVAARQQDAVLGPEPAAAAVAAAPSVSRPHEHGEAPGREDGQQRDDDPEKRLRRRAPLGPVVADGEGARGRGRRGDGRGRALEGRRRHGGKRWRRELRLLGL